MDSDQYFFQCFHLANQCSGQSIDNAIGQYGDGKFTGQSIGTVQCEEGYNSNLQTQGPLVCDDTGAWSVQVTCRGMQIPFEN